MDNEKFWLDDISYLYIDNNYKKIIPKNTMSKNEQFNSLTRLALLMTIFIFLFNLGEALLLIPIVLVLVVILFKYLDTPEQEAQMVLDQRASGFTDQNDPNEFTHDKDKLYKSFEEMTNMSSDNYSIKTGYFDPDYNMVLGPKFETPDFVGKEPQSIYKFNEVKGFNQQTCRPPTPNNPLMNTPATQFGVEDPPAACNVDDEDIKENIKVNFDHRLFRDVDELWERENSQRQFYTTLNYSVPNQQKEFAMWLYNTGDFNCKGDNEQCLRYDPLWYGADVATPKL
jgi:hypothetical protein